MNASQRRLRNVVLLYGLASMLVFSHLAYLMIGQNEAWELRSYRNRWAYRDVPARRGSIRDRQGELLVRDQPTTTLSVYYREFRRRHPCGIVIHGGNIRARLVAGQPLYRYGFEDVRKAFRDCLDLPMSALRSEAVDERLVGDLRFYSAALFAALTDGATYWNRFRRIRSRIGKALAAGRSGTLCQVLELEPEALRKVFDARLGDVERLAQAMADAGRDLWRELDVKREAYLSDWLAGETLIRSELVPRVLHRQLSYQLASSLWMRRELHPGLMLRASVDRIRSDINSMHGQRWESLAPLLGGVTLEWGRPSDELRRKSLLASIAPAVESMAAADAELSASQRRQVREGLENTMRNHLAVQGRVGRGGVERDLDAVLRGTAGLHWFVRSRRRREIGMWSSFDVTPGEDVYLTVDLRLQAIAEQAIDRALRNTPGSKVAAFCVIDPHTGDVLALASRPLRADRDEDKKFRMEPAISWWTAGDIGSLAKPLVLLEQLDALRRGRPALDQAGFVACAGRRMMPQVGRFKRHNLRCDHLHGAEGARDCVYSLGVSCNYYFYQVAEGLGWPGLRSAFGRFGLYRPSGGVLEASFQGHVPGIPAGQYPDPTWRGNDIQRRSIGYGIDANVLQIARAYAGLATGRLPELSLVVRDPQMIAPEDIDVHPDDLRRVQDGLRYCVERGTGRRLELQGVFAKTGTAEVNTKTGANNAWFAGYVVENGPKMAFAGVLYRVPSGRHGATAAGPMIKHFLEVLRRDEDLRKEFLGR